MSGPEENPRTLIGPKTALILYVVLVVAAVLSLTGKPRILALIIVGGLAAKSYLHYWKERSPH